METSNDRLSPMPPGNRLSIISDGSRFDADEKSEAGINVVDRPEKPPSELSGARYATAPATNKWIDKFFPNNLPCRLLIIVTVLEAIIDIAIQANLLWRYDQDIGEVNGWANGRRLRYFLVVFIIAQ